MKLYDYHTHNGFSGCASKAPYTVAEGWETIQKRGISVWGLSNHYPTAKVFGDYFASLRTEIDDLENENILLGVELELESEEGVSALSSKQQDLLDYVVGSVHNMPHHFLDLPDIEEDEIDEFFNSLRLKLIHGFQNIPVRIWGHPFANEFGHFGEKYWDSHLKPILYDLLDLISEKNIAFEVSPAYPKKIEQFPKLQKVVDEMFSMAMNHTDVYFVTSSDAHSLANLGVLDVQLNYVKKYQIPENRILVLQKK